jgi:hypothetical protein
MPGTRPPITDNRSISPPTTWQAVTYGSVGRRPWRMRMAGRGLAQHATDVTLIGIA